MRILIIEDDEKIARYIKRGLEENGYAVDLLFSGADVFDWVKVVDYDILILDIMLPEMNGIQISQRLRRENYRMPILMLTAKDAVDDRVAGLDAGADDYLVKPFALKELLARLRALSRRKTENLEPTVLRLADLELDTVSHLAKRGNIEIELRTKEYAVLEYFLRHQGMLLTRAMIAEQVWNLEVYHQSNVVDVYIRNLRRKIDDPFDIKLIQTIRGSGYKISEVQESS